MTRRNPSYLILLLIEDLAIVTMITITQQTWLEMQVSSHKKILKFKSSLKAPTYIHYRLKKVLKKIEHELPYVTYERKQ